MSSTSFSAIVLVGSMSVFAPSVNAAENAGGEEARIVGLTAVVVKPAQKAEPVSRIKRPAILPVLYATLGATQMWDVYSTRTALNAGAREANPATAAFSTSTGALIGLKAATTAGTILFAERMWKKNKVAAIVMLVAINGGTAAVSVHNMRNARRSAGQIR